MTIGFIIIRHVKSALTNLYWQESYRCIRQFYDNKIIIVDDNSDPKYVTTLPMENCELIKSEFPGRAELLPYYYFLKHGWFDTAVILHDSVFIQKPIKFHNANKFFWFFDTHQFDNIEYETSLIRRFTNNAELLQLYYNKSQWHGCFGVMSVISHTLLSSINSKYNFFEIIKYIRCRKERMCLERVFAVVLWHEAKLTKDNCSYFDNISKIKWGFREDYKIDNYKQDKAKGLITIPVVKLWSGR